MKSFGKFSLRVKEEDGKKYIWDPVRKIWLTAFPEEYVRQHVIAFLINELQVPAIYIASEWKINRGLRADVVVFGIDLKPKLIVECKAPDRKINPANWIQIFEYIENLRPNYLWLTNGKEHWLARFNYVSEIWEQIEKLPAWNDLKR